MSLKRRDPTPEQIAERAAEIRSGWSPEETLKRLRSDLRPSVVLCDGRRHDFSIETYESHHNTREQLLEAAGE
jgi:hypothetical protein